MSVIASPYSLSARRMPLAAMQVACRVITWWRSTLSIMASSMSSKVVRTSRMAERKDRKQVSRSR